MFPERKSLCYRGALAITAAFLLIAGCSNPAGDPEQPAFVPVSSITGVPESGFVGSEVDLTGAEVAPGDADNKAIVWTVKSAGTTGVSDADVAGGKFTPTGAGTLTLLATIVKGSSPDADYAAEFAISISAPDAFVPVSEISGVPDGGFVGSEVDLTGAEAAPATASNKAIVWTVKSAGTTGVSDADVADGKFTPTGAGTLTLLATIVKGSSSDADYAAEFVISISAPDAFVPVSEISGVPDRGTAGKAVILTGATVVPGTATYKDISWVVKEAGATGVTNAMVAAGSSFTPIAAGALILTARIASGKEEGTPYTQDFAIEIEPAFVPATDITGIPGNGITGLQVDLTVAEVVPSHANNKDIEWSVSDPGTTGLTTADVRSGIFVPTRGGTLKLTATILNGKAQGENFAKDAAITIIKPVTGIDGVPASGTRGYAISLAGARVRPEDATYKTIAWTVKDAGGAGVTDAMLAAGPSFIPTGTGVLELIATIPDGRAMGSDFIQGVTIVVNEPGVTAPGFGLVDDTSIIVKDKNGTTLSKDTAIQVGRNANYYVSIADSGYTDLVWYLNGTRQTEKGATIYLDTSTDRTFTLYVEGRKDGIFESSDTYIFEIRG
jgi:hypothetical protein